ncbi:hypothetical protein GW796_05685 [archaeon]|nr:hypothetical protein [archaeon]NCQ51375.1 hypothetical protein [archaeon]NCT58799.1 hypothetical protein [archaeon]
MKVVRVTNEEFELEDGSIHPILFELDYTPTVEEFQLIYDESVKQLESILHDK